MTRPSIPADAFDHGDPKRYRRGCRCRPCIDGVTAEVRRHGYLKATGRGALVSSDPAAAHIAHLRAAGAQDRDIMATANIAADVLYRILRREGQIHRSTEQRVLAVATPGGGAPGCGARVPGHGTVWRLRTLAANGWPAVDLGARAGKCKQFIVYLQNSSPAATVRQWVADYTRTLYAQIWELKPEEAGVTPYFAARTRTLAAKKGWPTSDYWDLDDFDNADFQPAVSDDIGRNGLAAYRRAEIERLARYGIPEQDIADRLDMATAYVHDIIRELQTEQAGNRTQAA